MKTETLHWSNITDDREKYQAYLCSREWSEKREAVRNRANGRCERCCLLKMDAVLSEPVCDKSLYDRFCSDVDPDLSRFEETNQ